jgi:drug/metabolite transporter (DMT)-like permease
MSANPKMTAPAAPALDAQALLVMVVICAMFGVQNVLVKVANSGISPIWQCGLRSIGATLLVALWAHFRGVRLWQADGTLWPGILAGILFASEFGLIYIALNYTDASRGVIFLYTAPFFVALGARWLLPNETMRSAQWLGMGLAFLGIVLLFGENLMRPLGEMWIGDAMMVLAAIFWAATTLTIKATRLAHAATEKTLLYQLAVSALALPLLSLGMGEAGVFAPSWQVWAALGYQIVGIATLSYLGWFWLVRRYPATQISSLSFLTPVMGVLAGILLLDEPLTWAIVLAMGLVGAGIWIANRPARRA